jgi:hypothetical protein
MSANKIAFGVQELLDCSICSDFYGPLMFGSLPVGLYKIALCMIDHRAAQIAVEIIVWASNKFLWLLRDNGVDFGSITDGYFWHSKQYLG